MKTSLPNKAQVLSTQKAIAVSTKLRNRNLEVEIRTSGLQTREHGDSGNLKVFSEHCYSRRDSVLLIYEIRWECRVLSAKGSQRRIKETRKDQSYSSLNLFRVKGRE